MKLGLIADTHDNVPMVKRAVEIFNRKCVDLVLHAGDYVAPFALKPMFSLKCDFVGVWGNNDGDKIALNRIAQGKIVDSPTIETIGEKKILLGHHLETLDSLITSQQFFLIVYGHTHSPLIRKEGRTMAVNPGECGGWIHNMPTVAICDFESQQAEIIEV